MHMGELIEVKVICVQYIGLDTIKKGKSGEDGLPQNFIRRTARPTGVTHAVYITQERSIECRFRLMKD